MNLTDLEILAAVIGWILLTIAIGWTMETLLKRPPPTDPLRHLDNLEENR